MPSFLITPVRQLDRLVESQVEPGRRAEKIAVIGVDGMLVNARTGGFLQPGENPLSLLTQQMERAATDPAVKAVVLRINSPGGTVTSSDALYEQILRFRAKTNKPVVASLQEVAASGGYYVACGADRIVAQPTTVVGSVGVIFYTFNFEGTLNKIGARSETVKSGPLKDMGWPFKTLHPEERAIMQGMIDEYHARFVAVITAQRGITDPEALKLIADGRVFTGERARAIGLVDDIGMLEDAIALARQLAEVPGASAVMYRRPYGYGGSIYAASETPTPDGQVMRLEIPGSERFLPTGFYYLWNP